MIGISSYLLINFWYTRIQANKSGIKALTVNRVGDMFLSIGFFAIFWVFGNVDYATVFSIAPFINESAITIIGLLLLIGAMAKSAQIGLHTWLPDRIEGWRTLIVIIFLIILLMHYSYSDDIIETYMNSLLVSTINFKDLQVITGNILGDGNISYFNITRNKGIPKGNCRYAITVKKDRYEYINWLYKDIYGKYSISNVKPYSRVLDSSDKVIVQYRFSTKSLPVFTELHNIWYKYNTITNKFVKIVPLNIIEIFTEISLAYWIMDDGYFDKYGRAQTIILCTENFTKQECELLQKVLLNININTTLKVRNKRLNTYRIRISKLSMPLVRKLVKPYFHNYFTYKLGE